MADAHSRSDAQALSLDRRLREAFRSASRPKVVHGVGLDPNSKRIVLFSSDEAPARAWLDEILEPPESTIPVAHYPVFGFVVDLTGSEERVDILRTTAGSDCEKSTKLMVAPGGSVLESGLGTIGCLVGVDGKAHLLSAEHVLATSQGNPIYFLPGSTPYVVAKQTAFNGGLGSVVQSAVGDFELGEFCASDKVVPTPRPECTGFQFNGSWIVRQDLQAIKDLEVAACTRDGIRTATVVAPKAYVLVHYLGFPGAPPLFEVLYDDQIVVKNTHALGWSQGHSGSVVACAIPANGIKVGTVLGVAYAESNDFIFATPFFTIDETLKKQGVTSVSILT